MGADQPATTQHALLLAPGREPDLRGGQGLVTKGYATAARGYSGKRPRTTYKITAAGRRALKQWLATPPRPTALECEPPTSLLADFASRTSSPPRSIKRRRARHPRCWPRRRARIPRRHRAVPRPVACARSRARLPLPPRPHAVGLGRPNLGRPRPVGRPQGRPRRSRLRDHQGEPRFLSETGGPAGSVGPKGCQQPPSAPDHPGRRPRLRARPVVRPGDATSGSTTRIQLVTNRRCRSVGNMGRRRVSRRDRAATGRPAPVRVPVRLVAAEWALHRCRRHRPPKRRWRRRCHGPLPRARKGGTALGCRPARPPRRPPRSPATASGCTTASISCIRAARLLA